MATPCCRLCRRAGRLAVQGSGGRRRDLPGWAAISSETAQRAVCPQGPGGEKLPFSLITHDLWHVFYQNQMQINGGRNNMFVAWADSAGFTMGHYANTSYDLRMWDLASEYRAVR